MERAQPTVVKQSDAAIGPTTPGMERREYWASQHAWAGWVRTEAGVSSAWHHHGGHDSYIYLARGSLTVDYGPGGRESVRAEGGDFVFSPAHLVHRETTSPDGDAEAFVVRIGDGPQLVNLDGPEPG